MENNNIENGKFSYTYSAKDQAEIKKIREKYTTPAKVEDKMTRLRRLDASVTNTAQAVALVLGVFGALLFGCGMSLFMTDIGNILGIHGDMTIVTGIIIGIVGAVVAGIAYPIYAAIVRSKRKKIAPEIIRLTDELMK